MEPCSDPLPRKKAAVGKARESLLCLRLYSRKKKAGYSTYIHKLLNQTWNAGASCLVAAALSSLNSPRLLGEVALEAARLSCYSRRNHLTHREILLAMKLVLLHELCKANLGSSSWQPVLKGPGEM
nr:PREDICTED: histone H2B type 1-K-like [Apteryx mantelli mantelli]